MDYLKPLRKSNQIAYYRLFEDFPEEIRSYIVSTPYSRNVLNRPEIYGCEYTNAMRKTMTLALKHFPESNAISGLDPRSISVIHFLRSGLNFGIRDSLYDALGFNTHLSSFLTSQRQRDQYGRWYIKDDQYRKLGLLDGDTLLYYLGAKVVFIDVNELKIIKTVDITKLSAEISYSSPGYILPDGKGIIVEARTRNNKTTGSLYYISIK